VDGNVPHPNIYWIHFDGAMSFDNVEQYLGDSQEDIKQEFAGRGFLINGGAYNSSGFASTVLGVTSLLNPDVYDATIWQLHEQVFTLPFKERAQMIINYTEQFGGINDIYDLNLTPELFSAFFEAGYQPILQFGLAGGGPFNSPIYRWYDYRGHPGKYLEISQYADITLRNFLELLSKTSSIVARDWERVLNLIPAEIESLDLQDLPEYLYELNNIQIDSIYEKEQMRILLDIFNFNQGNFAKPIIVYFDVDQLHAPYVVEGGITGSVLGLPSYHWRHKDMVISILKEIDMILRYDEDAIIIIQADHGVHLSNEWLTDNGYSLKEIADINYGTFSAIRIPEKYGGLDKPLNPMNITRELVNRFVGKGNYELLSDQVPFEEAFDKKIAEQGE
jgi:hypothetical protein